MNPSDEMRQLQLAYRLYQSSQVKDAYNLLQGIVRNNKRNYHAMHLLGIIELNNGNQSGIEYLKRSLEIEPPNLDFIENYAKTLRAVGNVKEAHRVCDHGLELSPRRPALMYMKAITACELGLIEESIEIFDRLLAANPNNWQCLNDKAIALSKSGDPSKAVEHLDRAIALNPNFATAHNNRGNALKRLGRFDDALSSFDRAVALRPDYAEAFCNRANTLRDIGRFEEAVVAYDKSIALAPHFFDAPYDKGLCILAMGNYREGFRLIEHRMKMPRLAKDYPIYAEPLLRASHDIDGKTVFIYKDLFFGDIIQFARYAKLAADRGAKVIFAAQDALHPLLRSLSPAIELIAENARPEAFDFHCPLMCLPRAFDTTEDAVPGETPYLRAEADRVSKWRERIGTERFKIGICWQGSKLSVLDGRSFALAEFRAIANLENVHLISLQKNDGVEQLARMPEGMKVEDFGDALDPGPGAFRDTAAIIEAVDLVITPDTAVAHLAGALGRPAWVVLKAHPEWRWMLEEGRTPWYPSLRLFRQTRPDDWTGVFKTIESALAETVRAKGVSREVARP